MPVLAEEACSFGTIVIVVSGCFCLRLLLFGLAHWPRADPLWTKAKLLFKEGDGDHEVARHDPATGQSNRKTVSNQPLSDQERSEAEDQIIYGKKGPLKTHPLFRKGLRASSRSPARAPLAALVSP
jgi:hypothetical protein